MAKEKPDEMKSIAVKFESAVLGGIVADYITVLYEKPVIDFNQLKKAKEFKIISSSKNKVGILISVKAIERYIAGRAKKLQKKYKRESRSDFRRLMPNVFLIFRLLKSLLKP